MSGRIISADNHYAELDNYIKESGCQSVMLVCDESLRFLDIRHYFDTLTDRLHVALTRFSDFKPNPLYESVEKGVGLFRRNRCDSMLYALHNQEMLAYLKNAERQETSVTARPFDKEAVAAIKSRHDRKLVFVALGMSAQFRKAADVSGTPYDFYTTQGVPLAGDNVEVIPYTTVNTQDYIAAADYVITKAGWGTVSECLLAGKRMALFRRDGVLEDRTTIRLLEEKHLAASVTAEELCDISGIIKKLDRLDGSCGGFDDCAAEVAEKLCSL